MYKIYFYRDKDGKEPIAEYITELVSKNDKNSRIKANKINDYITALEKYGLNTGFPYIKHIDGEIWELRPIRDRILFAVLYKNNLILLHHFVKKTQKTPKKEVEAAKSKLADLIKRGIIYE